MNNDTEELNFLIETNDGFLSSGKATLALLFSAALLSVLLLYFVVGDLLLIAGFGAVAIVGSALIFSYRRMFPKTIANALITPDWSVTRAAADQANIGLAITDKAGRMVCANSHYISWFSGHETPTKLALDDNGKEALVSATRAAWRDESGQVSGIKKGSVSYDAEVSKVGHGAEYLMWQFHPVVQTDLLAEANRLVGGGAGRAFAEVGGMAVIIGTEGRIRSANAAFSLRATGREESNIVGRDFTNFLRTDDKNAVFFEREGPTGTSLRLLHIPIDRDKVRGSSLVMLLDEDNAIRERGTALGHVEAMLSLLPMGLALTDRDGRFMFINKAFLRTAGADENKMPLYPGDLVIREDNSAVADAVRRYASGQQQSGDVAVRLRNHDDEPVILSMSSLRGMGDAAVLLSLKDNSEESKLKRQVAQATKMQAVGQLAGGVAHDFNNVLTAIIGHCDLMLLRHSPGDSDYDDIQQIKNNSNRAASLTRQLLAFSRQQTLRPQILQLPDVISEVSNLLKRLLGEQVKLEVHHGRNLGAVRADPGQLEQVIVNLAVNARDAMGEGGSLSIETKSVTSADVRKMKNEILPVGNYTCLNVSDTGEGIDPEILNKVFEPFFTTKEVGKGTGLGLSTVYGIVKQSDGYIFADSKLGKGTTFSIYLPVYEGKNIIAEPKQKKSKKDSAADLWGSGRILLVEDEDMVRAVAERALSRQGYSVVTARDGEDGLEKLEEDGAFDLIVSDVVMPIMDGPAMAKAAREKYPDLPILFMSGYAEEQLRKSISLNNVGFLPKPFSVAQIAEAVRDTLVAGD